MGRLTSPDPSNLSVDFWLPQTWNRYSYVLNNPLSMADRNGLWPFYIHEEIIDEAFPGMSKDQLQHVKDASFAMDYAPGQQDPANSYMHGMYDSSGTSFWGSGNQEHDRAQADDFISEQAQTAQMIQAQWVASGHSGIAPAALTAFGNALHTVTDRTSPAHRGTQPWANKPWWHPSTLGHFFREATISNADRRSTVQAAQSLFYGIFGNEFDYLMLMNKPDSACVTYYDSASGTRGGGCEK
jgi:hypothetical protein